MRTGTLIHLYRGPDYKGPPPRSKMNDITEAIGDYDLFGESDDLEEGDLMAQFEVEDGISKFSYSRFDIVPLDYFLTCRSRPYRGSLSSFTFARF